MVAWLMSFMQPTYTLLHLWAVWDKFPHGTRPNAGVSVWEDVALNRKLRWKDILIEEHRLISELRRIDFTYCAICKTFATDFNFESEGDRLKAEEWIKSYMKGDYVSCRETIRASVNTAGT